MRFMMSSYPGSPSNDANMGQNLLNCEFTSIPPTLGANYPEVVEQLRALGYFDCAGRRAGSSRRRWSRITRPAIACPAPFQWPSPPPLSICFPLSDAAATAS